MLDGPRTLSCGSNRATEDCAGLSALMALRMPKSGRVSWTLCKTSSEVGRSAGSTAIFYLGLALEGSCCWHTANFIVQIISLTRRNLGTQATETYATVRGLPLPPSMLMNCTSKAVMPREAHKRSD